MKITIDVDCTPEELRDFLGLPDVAPLQRAFVAEMRSRMQEALASLDAEALMKAWMPKGMAGWEEWQRMWQRGGAKRDE